MAETDETKFEQVVRHVTEDLLAHDELCQYLHAEACQTAGVGPGTSQSDMLDGHPRHVAYWGHYHWLMSQVLVQATWKCVSAMSSHRTHD